MNGNRKTIVMASGAAALAVVVAAAAFWAGAASRAVGIAGQESAAPGAGAAEMSGMETGGMGTSGAGIEGMAPDGSVFLTPGEISSFGITFDRAEVRLLSRTTRTVGIVAFDETRVAYLAPKFGGWVERLHVNFTGQPVRQGQPLLDVYSPELVTAQEELLLATRMAESIGRSPVAAVADGARELVESARRRLTYWDISEDQIEAVLESGEPRRTLTIHAPVSGVVLEKDVLEGQAFQPGTNLYMIADLSVVWVNAEVREPNGGGVAEGSEAVVELSAFPSRPIRGRIEYVYPTLQEDARTLRARVAVPNPDGRLKPGMYATVSLSTPTRTALSVPTSAVIDTGERQLVFIEMGGGRLIPQEVEVGLTAGDLTEVLAGLEPGQRVVTSAQYLLDSESNMAQVMRSMIGMIGAGDMGNLDMGGMDMSDDSMDGMPMPPNRE
ncbi:MAG: efflux RND transporter periplasmic adaptor subunit [Gemmatimonadota bacterium]